MFADDISDFQIEGISIGDSLLKYLDEDHIKEDIDYSINELYNYKTEEFAEIFLHKKTKNYDLISFIVTNDLDKKYIIHQINGRKKISISDCLELKKKIVNDFRFMFPNAEVSESKFIPSFDDSGKSTIYYTYFILHSNDEIAVECYDYSEKISFFDVLMINLNTEEVSQWLKQRK